MFAGSHLDAKGRERATNFGVAKNVVGRGGLFNPAQVEAIELTHPLDGLRHVPYLIGIDHQLHIVAEFFAHDLAASTIGDNRDAHFGLEAAPPFAVELLAQVANFGLGVTQPASRSDVGRVTIGHKFGSSRRLARGCSAQYLECFVAG